MGRQVFSVLLVIGILFPAFSQTKYSKVKFDLSKVDISELSRLGLEVDHGAYIPGVHFVNVFSDSEIALLKAHGIDHYVIVDDVQTQYQKDKNSPVKRSTHCEEGLFYDYQTPENYTYGSMGGYHTYDEMLEVLHSMAERFPNLITPVNSIEGFKTWQNNDIIWLRISDNPLMDEDEPEALYTALHHAREPNSLSQMIFYMWYLLENYDNDDHIKYLVDNTELYFLPCINPDGYKYNQLTDPEGGGFWRKNRRINEDGETVGVDLNRNYGYFWGFDDNGSSPNMGSSTYRGPQAFSEPETQAVRDFCINHEFKVALNYHTHGNLLIHPWGYNDAPTEEDQLFKAMGRVMVKENNFVVGTGTETVGYVVNGDSDDYMYGEQAEKNKIYSFTPEVGPRFWPQEDEIDQLNKSSLLMNLNTANILLNYYDVNVRIDNPIVSTLEGNFDMSVSKPGLKPGGATITIVSQDPDLLMFDQTVFQMDMQSGETQMFNLQYNISENAPPLQDLSFEVSVDNGENATIDTYTFTLRRTTFEEEEIDEFADLGNWDAEESSWGLTEEHFVSAPFSLTDSPNSDYDNATEESILFIPQISIEDRDFTSLKFSARWDIEFNYDYVMIQVSNDNGDNWTSLCGNYSRSGVNTHGTSDPLYDGLQDEWILEEIDLSDYRGEDISLRLLLVSDQFVTGDGFYIDDILIENNTLIALSTEDQLDANSFSILPSLNNGTFDIDISEQVIDEAVLIEVLDVQGRTLKHIQNPQSLETVRLNNAGSGIYIVKLTNKEGKFLSKKINVIR